MADKYIDSAGSNTPPYETPATAANSFSTFINSANIATGEKIFVGSDNVDAGFSANTILTSSASVALYHAPQQLLCVANTETPTTLASGAIIGTTGNFSLSLSGNFALHGIVFHPGYAGTPGTTNTTTIGSTAHHANIGLAECKFKSGYTGTTAISVVTFGHTGTAALSLCATDCEVQFNHSANRISIGAGDIRIEGLTITGDVTSASNIFYALSYPITAVIRNGDFTNFTTACTLVNPSLGRSGQIRFVNCKFPPNVTVLSQAIVYPSFDVYIINCDSGDTNKRYEKYSYSGSIVLDTGIYATTNPSTYKDGANYSIKMTGLASKCTKFLPLETEWINKWAEAGVEVTLDVECLVEGDGATALNDDELWLSVEYMGESGTPFGISTSTEPDLLTAPSVIAAGTIAWTGDGYTTERTHKLTKSFVPQQDGYYRYKMSFAKPNAAVYVNMV